MDLVFPEKWETSRRIISLKRNVTWMGIVNITPDSFSDGGAYFTTDRAVRHALELINTGADILDLGAESTRPGAEPISEDEELARLMPVLRELVTITDVPLSVDTRHLRVAQIAADAGAEIINDLSAVLHPEENTPELQKQWMDFYRYSGVGICWMHASGAADHPWKTHDIISDVMKEMTCKKISFLTAGISRERLVFDPGLGFSKNTPENLLLVHHAYKFHELGTPILFGHSRKRFLKEVAARNQLPWNGTLEDMDRCTHFISKILIRHHVQILRTHVIPDV